MSREPDQSVHPDAARFGGWSWRAPERGEHFRRCSFCGSVHPEDLVAEPVWSAEWSDMKYGWPHKFYVDIPNRDPATLYVIGSSRGAKRPERLAGDTWVAWEDLTAEQRAVVTRDGYDRDENNQPQFLSFGTHANHFGKFYSIHLSDAGLAAEVKQQIEQRAGIAFEFDGDRVTWRRPQP